MKLLSSPAAKERRYRSGICRAKVSAAILEMVAAGAELAKSKLAAGVQHRLSFIPALV